MSEGQIIITTESIYFIAVPNKLPANWRETPRNLPTAICTGIWQMASVNSGSYYHLSVSSILFVSPTTHTEKTRGKNNKRSV